eukprot:gene5737-6170_t
MGPKKGKKSKAELEEERLAREEEERKQKALEEKRLAEEREKKRQEELKLASELKTNREKQLNRLQEEYNEIIDDNQSKLQQLQAEEKKEQLHQEWLQYLDPSDEPNALIESDMNTFITIMKESNITEIKDGLESIKKIEKIAISVEEVWANSYANQQPIINQRSLSQLYTLKDMIIEKINQFTIPLIRFADKIVNDRMEINIEEIAHQVGIGMWSSFHDIRPIRKSIQFELLGVQLDIPKQLLQQHEFYIYRIIRIPIVPYNLEPYTQTLAYQSKPNDKTPPDEINTKLQSLYSKYIVGDLIEFDILISPPREYQLRAKKWVLRDYSEISKNLRKSSYPSSVACRMFIKVPDNILFGDDLRIAVWNEEASDWTEDGITDYQYNENNRMIQFYITTVGTLALIRKRNIHIPIKQWSLYPILVKPINTLMNYHQNNGMMGSSLVESANKASSSSFASVPSYYEKHCRLLFEYLKEEIKIDIIHTQCYLIQPETLLYQDILGKSISPGLLMLKLLKKGINLMSLPFDFIQCDSINTLSQPKHAIFEQQIVQQIAKTCNALEYASSADWNNQLNPSQIGIFVRETCIYTNPLEQNEYECLLAERDEVSIAYQNTPDLGIAPGPEGVQYTFVLGNEYGKRGSLYSTIPYEYSLQ